MLRGRSIDELLYDRENNFDFIRFVAAALVIFSHAYPLTGVPGAEPFGILSNGLMSFGGLAVKIFFIISGFLITRSFDRSSSVLSYTKARSLRIFPALIVVVLLSILLIGPIFTTLGLGSYFLHPQTIGYLKSITLYRMQYNLPGVFEFNPNQAVNGSLWTLWYEFFFYIVVAVLGMAKLLNKKATVAGFVIASILFYFGKGEFYADLFRYFGAGMLVYLFRKNIIHNGWLALLSLIVLALTIKTTYFNYSLPIFGSYLVFYLSFLKQLKLQGFGKYGDFSYGLYIYAFPIQQIVVYTSNNKLSAVENFFISFPITLVLAVLSWHLVEKTALKWKKGTQSHKHNSVMKDQTHSGEAIS